MAPVAALATSPPPRTKNSNSSPEDQPSRKRKSAISPTSQVQKRSRVQSTRSSSNPSSSKRFNPAKSSGSASASSTRSGEVQRAGRAEGGLEGLGCGEDGSEEPSEDGQRRVKDTMGNCVSAAFFCRRSADSEEKRDGEAERGASDGSEVVKSGGDSCKVEGAGVARAETSGSKGVAKSSQAGSERGGGQNCDAGGGGSGGAGSGSAKDTAKDAGKGGASGSAKDASKKDAANAGGANGASANASGANAAGPNAAGGNGGGGNAAAREGGSEGDGENAGESSKESGSVLSPGGLGEEGGSRHQHGSRRRLSLVRADPIRHESSSGPRGMTGVIKSGSREALSEGAERWELEKLLSMEGSYSVAGAAAKWCQSCFENKEELVKGAAAQGGAATALRALGIGHACRKGLKPESPNQDDFFLFHLQTASQTVGLYGVFDGHGPYGHDISNYVQKRFPALIYDHQTFQSKPAVSLAHAFEQVQNEIQTANERHQFDATLSGCTATVLVHDLKKHSLTVAHVGDSRAVLATKDPKSNKLRAIELTEDHKPTLPQEKARIEAKGGEVKRLEGDIPHRVFLKDKLYPGLAMSRALGDLVAVQAGVSSTPEVKEYQLNLETDLFVLICSDGVWEFISSQQAVDIINERVRDVTKPTDVEVQELADFLAKESWNRWIAEEGEVVDDITVELIYLHPPTPT